jgi:hypothetical protein
LGPESSDAATSIAMRASGITAKSLCDACFVSDDLRCTACDRWANVALTAAAPCRSACHDQVSRRSAFAETKRERPSGCRMCIAGGRSGELIATRPNRERRGPAGVSHFSPGQYSCVRFFKAAASAG